MRIGTATDHGKKRYTLFLLVIGLTLATGCSGQSQTARPDASVRTGQTDSLSTADAAPEDEQASTESGGWEELYERWQGGLCETRLSFGQEIYSVGAERRYCGDSTDIFVTYNFLLNGDETEAVMGLMTKEEHVITNNVLKSVVIYDSVTLSIADDSGCIKEIGLPAAANCHMKIGRRSWRSWKAASRSVLFMILPVYSG